MKINFKPFRVLFFCIILNIIPSAIYGIFRIPEKIYTMLYAIVYLIQSVLLFISFKNDLKLLNKKIFFVYILSFVNCMVTLTFSFYKFGNIDKNEIIFILSLLFNTLILIVAADKKKINKEEIIDFFKKFVFLGIISCIFNFIINYKNMLNLSSITSSYKAAFSSFFPNRNQFGLFLLLEIFSLSVLSRSKNEKYYNYIYILFITNLILTMSRNSILGLFIFATISCFNKYVVEKKKIKKNQFILYFLGINVALISIYILINNSNIYELINRLFIRSDTIEGGNGRLSVWQNGISIAMNNNPLFGVGRFKGIEINKILYGSELEYFHSIYVEKFVTHGIVGLAILVFYMSYVWKKVCNIKENDYIKSTIKAFLLSVFIISIFETTTRFSIGYSDFMFLIFVFTIPILISNASNNS